MEASINNENWLNIHNSQNQANLLKGSRSEKAVNSTKSKVSGTLSLNDKAWIKLSKLNEDEIFETIATKFNKLSENVSRKTSPSGSPMYYYNEIKALIRVANSKNADVSEIEIQMPELYKMVLPKEAERLLSILERPSFKRGDSDSSVLLSKLEHIVEESKNIVNLWETKRILKYYQKYWLVA